MRDPTAGAAAVLLLAALSACSIFKNNQEAQDVVNRRVVGSTAGEFFERYGPWKNRLDQPDGSVHYSWISEGGPVQYSGYYGLDSRTCTMRLVVGKNGRIVSADVVQDNPGRTTTSRCLEIFRDG